MASQNSTPGDWQLLEQYFAGDATAEDLRVLTHWLGCEPDTHPQIATLQAAIAESRLSHGKSAPDSQQALEKLFREMQTGETPKQANGVLVQWPRHQQLEDTRRRRMFGVGTWTLRLGISGLRTRPVQGVPSSDPRTLRRGPESIATALIVCAMVAILGWTTAARDTHARPSGEMLTYTTGNGQRATITLPDGGAVMLNVASRLEVPMDYMRGNHTLQLVGEGLFTLTHNAETPVTVITGETQTRVLGTSFVIRRYPTDTSELVAVRDGKVLFGATVVAAERAAVMTHKRISYLGPASASLFTFAAGVLSIDSLPLPAAIVELDRWFDVDIRLGDPKLATQYLTGKFAAGSLGDLAEILELTFHVRVVRNGRVLTLMPKQS